MLLLARTERLYPFYYMVLKMKTREAAGPAPSHTRVCGGTDFSPESAQTSSWKRHGLLPRPSKHGLALWDHWG